MIQARHGSYGARLFTAAQGAAAGGGSLNVDDGGGAEFPQVPANSDTATDSQPGKILLVVIALLALLLFMGEK